MKKSVCQFFFIFFFQRTKFSFSSVCSALCKKKRREKQHTFILQTHTKTHTHTKRFYYTRFLWDDDDEFDH